MVAGAPSVSRVAYFSMEVVLNLAMPAHSGGLGILSGDTLRSAAALGIPVAAVSLLHRNRQRLDENGGQPGDSDEGSPR